MAKLRTAAVRNRPVTERKLTRAVEKLLARGGFGMLGPSAVAREAGVDKKLIYRYFGNLDGLVAAVVQSSGLLSDARGDLRWRCCGDARPSGASADRNDRGQLRTRSDQTAGCARDDGVGDGRA